MLLCKKEAARITYLAAACRCSRLFYDDVLRRISIVHFWIATELLIGVKFSFAVHRVNIQQHASLVPVSPVTTQQQLFNKSGLPVRSNKQLSLIMMNQRALLQISRRVCGTARFMSAEAAAAPASSSSAGSASA